jgi:hypothetical protein
MKEKMKMSNTCPHQHVIIIGNEEEGAKAFFCEDCEQYLHRIVEDGEYVYVSKEPANA